MDRIHITAKCIASALLALALFAGLPAAVSAAQAPAPDADTIYTEAGEAVAVTDAPEDLSISSGGKPFSLRPISVKNSCLFICVTLPHNKTVYGHDLFPLCGEVG